MRRVFIHLFDLFAIVGGGLLILGGLIDATQAAGTEPPFLALNMMRPALTLVGFAMFTLPLTRRFAYHALTNPANVVECGDVGRALHRIGLLQRVHEGNLYAVDLDDAALARALDGQDGLWRFLGPAYQDPQLRRQIDPSLLARLEAIADKPVPVHG